jgi:O-antigen/teichoic acid export membrane protein
MFDKLKQLSKDTAVYGVSTMIGRFLNFLLVPFYTHVFLPSEYGIISLVYLLIAIMQIAYLYGMDASFLKFAGMENEENSKSIFSTPFLSVIFSSLLFSLVIILTRDPVFSLLGIPAQFHFIGYYTAAILFLDAVNVIPFIKLRLQRKAKKFAAFKIVNITVNIILSLYLILVLNWGIEAVFLANLAASFTGFLLLIPTIVKELEIKLDWNMMTRFFKFGLPYLPAGIAATVIQVIDRTILERLTDLSTVGIYQANYKLGIFMMLFVSMFQFAWQPFFLQNAKEENAKEIFSKVLTYFTIIGSLILILLSLFIDNIVSAEFFGRNLINPRYWGGLNIVPIILFAYLFNGMYAIFTAGIYIKEKSQYVPLITGIGAATNIGVNILLIPILGIMGAAFATFASYFVLAAGMYIVTQKFYKIDYEYGRIVKILILIIGAGILYYYLLNNNQLFLINKILILTGFIVSLFLFVLDKKELMFIKNKFTGRNKNE